MNASTPGPVKHRGSTLTTRPDGKVEIVSDKPGSYPVVRTCMKWAIEFVDTCADFYELPSDEFIAKYADPDDK